MGMTSEKAAAMTDRLIDAAVYAETASGPYVSGARKELSEARAAIIAALSSSAGPAEPVAYASAEQIAELVVDRPGDGGSAYIPLRKTPAG